MKIKILLLVLVDLALMLLGLWLALLIRFGKELNPEMWQRHWQIFLPLFLAWLLVFYIDGFYELRSIKKGLTFYSHFLRDLIINLVITIVAFYFLGSLTSLKPQRVLLFFTLIFSASFYLWRLLFDSLLKTSPWLNKVLIVGLNESALDLAKEIIHKKSFGYQLVGIINWPINNLIVEPNFASLIIAESIDQLPKIAQAKKIDIIINANPNQADSKLTNALFACLPLRVDIASLPTFYENLTNKVPIHNIRPTWFLENLAGNRKKPYEILKRGTDLLLATGGSLLGIVFIPVIALLIKISSPGPVFFKQIRTGQNGKNFLAIKLRTMIVGAEKNGPQWASQNDPRITGLGKFLRKTRLDEIPQFYNIIRGEMSFIGPRPERPEFIETLQEKIPFYKERLLVKPGLTGWAQINAGYSGTFEGSLEKVQYDLYYIKNRSLILDLSIILKTIKIVLSGGGQ
ncbi:MAG: sugar transferase [Candidatus Buchananbacteria bacterium]